MPSGLQRNCHVPCCTPAGVFDGLGEHVHDRLRLDRGVDRSTCQKGRQRGYGYVFSKVGPPTCWSSLWFPLKTTPKREPNKDTPIYSRIHLPAYRACSFDAEQKRTSMSG